MKKNLKPDFDLIDMLKAIYEKAWAVILAAAIFAAAAAAWTNVFIKQKYETSVTFYVKDSSFALGNTGINLTDGNLDETPHPVSSYNIILKTEKCLNEISEKANIGFSSSDVAARVSATTSSSTEAFKVTVWDYSPENAVVIANAVAETLPEKVEEIIDGCKITPIEDARPAVKSAPSVKKNTVLGLFAGIFLSALIIIIRKYTDPKIRSEEFIKEADLPLLAVIPKLKDTESLSDSAKKEFGKLRTFVFRSESKGNNAKIIGITSTLNGEGKTFTALNLAKSIAKANKRVLIIDTDTKNNSAAKALGIPENNGITKMLKEGKFSPDCIHTLPCNADIITAGNNAESTADIPLTDILSEMINNTKEKYDYITVKLPPVKSSSEAAAFAYLADGMIIIVKKDVAFKTDFADAVNEIEQAEGKIIGAVFNGAKPSYKTLLNR